MGMVEGQVDDHGVEIIGEQYTLKLHGGYCAAKVYNAAGCMNFFYQKKTLLPLSIDLNYEMGKNKQQDFSVLYSAYPFEKIQTWTFFFKKSFGHPNPIRLKWLVIFYFKQEMSQTRDECPQRNWSSIRHI